MDLNKAKAHAAKILGVGKSRVWINAMQSERVKEAITKDDLRALIKERIIVKKKTNEQSSARAKERHAKKKKGQRKGKGSRQGHINARIKPKKRWIGRVRAQRRVLRELKKTAPEKVKKIGYRKLYLMIKGNAFKGKKYLEKAVE